MAAFFFLVLAALACIVLPVNWTLLSGSARDSLLGIHSNEIQVLQLQQDQFADRAYKTAGTLAALLENETVSASSKYAVRTICSILDNMDRDMNIRLLSYISVTMIDGAMCAHGDVRLSSLRDLARATINSGIMSDSYRIDRNTYSYAEPRVIVDAVPPGKSNVTDTFKEMTDPHAFAALEALYDVAAGKLDEIPHELYWSRNYSMNAIIAFRYPFFVYQSEEKRAQGIKDGILFTQVRIDGRRLAMSPFFTAKSVPSRVLAFKFSSITEDNPIVMSNNWGQPVTTEPYGYNNIYHGASRMLMHASDIEDPLMRSAIKYFDLMKLAQRNYSQQVLFEYDGSFAVATAWQYTTPMGLEGAFVLVTPLAAIAGATIRNFRIICGCVAAVVVLLTLAFRFVISRCLGRPLQRMAAAMAESARMGHALAKRKIADRGSKWIRVTEVDKIIETYNGAMTQLRQIDTFVQPNLFQALRAARSSCSSDGSRSITGSCADLSDGALDASAGREAATQCYVTSVILRTFQARHLCSGGARQGVGDRMTSSVVEAIFSPAELEAYLGSVFDLAEMYGGFVQQVSPEDTTVYFCRQTLRAQRSLRNTGVHDAQRAGEVLLAARRKDAVSGARFAVQMRCFTERERARTRSFPPVYQVVDTCLCICMQLRTPNGASAPLFMGRGVAHDLALVLPALQSPLTMTEETIELVGGHVRAIPMEVLQVGCGIRGANYCVVLYEVFAGDVEDAAWVAYWRYFRVAFGSMLQGNYRSAMDAFDELSAIPGIDVGLLPADDRALRLLQLHREHGPHLRLEPGAPTSQQLDRLYSECVKKVLMRDGTPYIRRPLSLDFLRSLQQPLGARRAIADRRASPTGSSRHRPGGSTTSLTRTASTASTRSTASTDVGQRLRTLPSVAYLRDAQREHGAEDEEPCQTDPATRHTDAIEGTGLVVAYTRPTVVTDNNGAAWRIGGRTLNRPQTPAHLHMYVGLSASGTLAITQLCVLRSAAVRRAAPPPPACAEWMEAWKTEEDLAAAPLLFPATLMSEHTVGFLGYSTEPAGALMPITEYYPGGNLREMLARYGRALPPAVITRYMASILSGLQFLHSQGIVHGDVRPENVLVGTGGRAKLRGFFGDLALAQRVLVRAPLSGVSPEQAAGLPATPASDIYCAGLVLLEALTGCAPWRWQPALEAGRTPDELQALVARGGADLRRAVSSGEVVPAAASLDGTAPFLASILDGSLHRDPRQRMTAAALLDLA